MMVHELDGTVASVVAAARRRVAMMAWLIPLAGCSGVASDVVTSASTATAGAPALMRAYGCQSCHVIPGVRGARGRVGPSLEGLASRAYIGGVLINTPENLALWVQTPSAYSPRTAMPDVGISEEDARVIAAYLHPPR
jgi:cytochrome c